ncbi:MAG: hypothetical protein U1E36_09490 [Rickettsiales bacterium]
MQAALNAIQKCEKILETLGAKITCGGEIEWYSIVDTPRLSMKPAAMKAEIIHNISSKPDIFDRFWILNCDDQNIESYCNKFHISKNDAIIRVSKEALVKIDDGDIDEKQLAELATALIMTRVMLRADKEGIPIYVCEKENGYVASEMAVQHEISTKPGTAYQQAIWLNTLRSLITEESRKLETLADFEDKPDYTHRATAAGNGLHIHYGLIDAKTGENLMATGLPAAISKKSLLYSVCADGVLEVARQGGIILGCPYSESYDRLQKGGTTLPKVFNEGTEDASCVKENSIDGQLHQELRIPGSKTPPSLAVLLTTLGIVYGIAEELNIGQSPADRIDPWRRHLSRGYKGPDMLDSIQANIKPETRSHFLNMRNKPSRDVAINKGPIPLSLQDAMNFAERGSILEAYCPQVMKEIGEKHAALFFTGH